ncbi:MAG: hypothetical protein APR63_03265 [Desulfuromonas sp. SDB]|nr:MAG: hypothetical protein APR63_03265 [Desulfuromonas sp. SDB]
MKLNINNLSYGFDDKVILDRLNLILDLDDHYVLTGAVGSGKTTLAEILSGYRCAQQGTIKLGGAVIDDPLCLVSKFGLIKQNLNNQRLFDDPVQEIIFSLENRGIKPGDGKKILDKLIREWDIKAGDNRDEMMLDNLNTLTASLLAAGKEFLIFDEVLVLLGAEHRKKFIRSVFNCHRGSLFITQYPQLVNHCNIKHLQVHEHNIEFAEPLFKSPVDFSDLNNFHHIRTRKELYELKAELIRRGSKIQYLPYFAENYFYFNNLTEELAWSGILINAFMEKALSAGIPEDFNERSPLSLSGGERRKLTYLIALEINSDCLFIEHPLLYLDHQGLLWLKQIFSDYLDRGGHIYYYLPDSSLLSPL